MPYSTFTAALGQHKPHVLIILSNNASKSVISAIRINARQPNTTVLFHWWNGRSASKYCLMEFVIGPLSVHKAMSCQRTCGETAAASLSNDTGQAY